MTWSRPSKVRFGPSHVRLDHPFAYVVQRQVAATSRAHGGPAARGRRSNSSHATKQINVGMSPHSRCGVKSPSDSIADALAEVDPVAVAQALASRERHLAWGLVPYRSEALWPRSKPLSACTGSCRARTWTAPGGHQVDLRVDASHVEVETSSALSLSRRDGGALGAGVGGS